GKERDNRLHSIADARLELEDLGTASTSDERRPAVTRRTAVAALSGAAAGAAATGVFAISRYRGSVRRNLTRFVIEVPDGRFHVPSFNRRVAISPNGANIAFAAANSDGPIPYLRSLSSLESK